VKFSQFLAATHISSVICDKVDRDKVR